MIQQDLLGLYSGQSGDLIVTRFSAGAPTGLAVTGPLKLAQQYLTRLLLHRGSMAGEPNEGTTLVAEIRSGQIRANTDLVTAWRQADLLVQQAFARELANYVVPLDERLATTELLKATIIARRANIAVRLVSAAGIAVPIIVPAVAL